VTRRLENCRLSIFFRKSHIEKLTDCDAYFEHTGEYYFERSPVIFEYIVDFFVTGSLSLLLSVRIGVFFLDSTDFFHTGKTDNSKCFAITIECYR
ncbi:K+ channel tetramerization domain protein, partial [Oesophagostomum dentatum]